MTAVGMVLEVVVVEIEMQPLGTEGQLRGSTTPPPDAAVLLVRLAATVVRIAAARRPERVKRSCLRRALIAVLKLTGPLPPGHSRSCSRSPHLAGGLAATRLDPDRPPLM